MSKINKLIEKLKSKPKDFTWDVLIKKSTKPLCIKKIWTRKNGRIKKEVCE
jgi:hypothetical protein